MNKKKAGFLTGLFLCFKNLVWQDTQSNIQDSDHMCLLSNKS